jgi:hypothetical protein
VLDHEPVVTLIRKPATAESLQNAIRQAMSKQRARSQSAERSPAPRRVTAATPGSTPARHSSPSKSASIPVRES